MGVNCGSVALCASKNSNSVKWIDKRSAQGGGGGGRGAKEDAREQEQPSERENGGGGGGRGHRDGRSGGVGAHIIGPTTRAWTTTAHAPRMTALTPSANDPVESGGFLDLLILR